MTKMNFAGLMGQLYRIHGLMDGLGYQRLNAACGPCGGGGDGDSACDVATTRDVPKHVVSTTRPGMASPGHIPPCVLPHGGATALAVPKPQAIPSP